MWLLFQLLPYLFFLTKGQEMSVETEAGMSKMSFTPPELSEEDKHQVHMPEYLRCDGCKAVSYSIHKAFEDRHKHIKDPQWKLQEGDVLDIFGMFLISYF